MIFFKFVRKGEAEGGPRYLASVGLESNNTARFETYLCTYERAKKGKEIEFPWNY